MTLICGRYDRLSPHRIIAKTPKITPTNASLLCSFWLSLLQKEIIRLRSCLVSPKCEHAQWRREWRWCARRRDCSRFWCNKLVGIEGTCASLPSDSARIIQSHQRYIDYDVCLCQGIHCSWCLSWGFNRSSAVPRRIVAFASLIVIVLRFMSRAVFA